MSRTNIYCDESSHLEHDGHHVMVLGALSCPASESRRIADAIRDLVAAHGLDRFYEAKWTKVSRGQLALYQAIIDLFFQEQALTFRSVIIKDKSVLDHAKFSQTHDEWYYKMYFNTLRRLISRDAVYRVFLDIKDTRGGQKAQRLHDILCSTIGDRRHEYLESVNQMRSHESPLIQLVDILIGAVAYKNKGSSTSAAKLALVAHLESKPEARRLTASSRIAERKFNIFVWSGRGG